MDRMAEKKKKRKKLSNPRRWPATIVFTLNLSLYFYLFAYLFIHLFCSRVVVQWNGSLSHERASDINNSSRSLFRRAHARWEIRASSYFPATWQIENFIPILAVYTQKERIPSEEGGEAGGAGSVSREFLSHEWITLSRRPAQRHFQRSHEHRKILFRRFAYLTPLPEPCCACKFLPSSPFPPKPSVFSSALFFAVSNREKSRQIALCEREMK